MRSQRKTLGSSDQNDGVAKTPKHKSVETASQVKGANPSLVAKMAAAKLKESN